MFKYLLDVIKNMEGNVITIGIDDKLINGFKKNKKVNVYEINKSENVALFQKKKRKMSNGKNINIKKLYKYFKKKSIDYIICDYEQIIKYYKYVFRDSIYLNKGKIYFYLDKNMDMDYILKYKRYNSKIEVKEYENTKLIIIDNSSSKTNKVKNILFYISDTFNNFLDFISNILVG